MGFLKAIQSASVCTFMQIANIPQFFERALLHMNMNEYSKLQLYRMTKWQLKNDLKYNLNFS